MAKLQTEHPILKRINQFHKLSYQIGDHINEEELPHDPEEALHYILEANKACEECVLFETRNHVVGPDGVFGAPIMVVLEGPGFLEDLTQLPLVGQQTLTSSHCNRCTKVGTCFDQRISFGFKRAPGKKRSIECDPNYVEEKQITRPFNLYSSGGVIDGILEKKYKGAFPRESWRRNYMDETQNPYKYRSPWFITNSVQCRAWDPDSLRDVPPPTIALDTCRPWLALQWACLQPRAIIAMGRLALGSILGNRSQAEKEDFDTIVDSPLGPVVFTKHPAANMRIRSDYLQALGHAKTAKAFDTALTLAGLIEGDELKPLKL